MSSLACEPFLSIHTRFGGYAISIVIPKMSGDYFVLANEGRRGIYRPDNLHKQAVELWQECVNQPRKVKKHVPVGPCFLVASHADDRNAVGNLLDKQGISPTYRRVFEVAPEQVEPSLMNLQRLFGDEKIKASPEVNNQLKKVLAGADTLDFEKGFKIVPLGLSAITQAIADHQFGKPPPYIDVSTLVTVRPHDSVGDPATDRWGRARK